MIESLEAFAMKRDRISSPLFSPSVYCGGGYGHVYGVALPWAPRHTVKYACGALRRAPCIHARLRRLETKYGEKSGLGSKSPYKHFYVRVQVQIRDIEPSKIFVW